MLMHYHIGRLVLSSLCVGSFCCGWYLVVFVLQVEALVLQPAKRTQSQAPEDGYINVRNMLSA